MQQQEQKQQEHDDVEAITPLCLPAKKRKESRNPPTTATATVDAVVTTTATYCLPAKKRVWAIQPDLIPDKPLSPFDLNVEYEPPLEEEKEEKREIPFVDDINQSTENSNEEKEDEDEPSSEEEKEEEEAPFVDDICQSTENSTEEKEEAEDDEDGIVCAICQSTDGDPIDPIVLCDGCDLMVHTTCYGNPLIKGIPEGDWFCHQCLSQAENEEKAFSCCLCPSLGGALKPIGDGRWAHVVCAVFVPEVFFSDPEGRDGIDWSKVPASRWEGKCYVCDSKSGCVIDCSEPKCGLAFHVTCGLKEELCIEYNQGRNKGDIVAGFCKDHTELWKKVIIIYIYACVYIYVYID